MDKKLKELEKKKTEKAISDKAKKDREEGKYSLEAMVEDKSDYKEVNDLRREMKDTLMAYANYGEAKGILLQQSDQRGKYYIDNSMW